MQRSEHGVEIDLRQGGVNLEARRVHPMTGASYKQLQN